MGRKHETEELQKNQRRLLQEKKLKRKKRKEQQQQQPPNTVPELSETDEKLNNVEEEDTNKKSTGNKKRRRDKERSVDVGAASQITTAGRENEKNKVSRKKKRKNDRKNDDAIESSDQPDTSIKDGSDTKNDEKLNNVEEENTNKKSTGNKKRRDKDKNVDVGASLQITTAGRENKKNKVSRKKKRKIDRKNDDAIESSDQPDTGIKDGSDEKNDDDGATNLIQSETPRQIGKSKKSGRNKKKNRVLSKESGKVPESSGEAVPDNVYHISSGDKDFSKGMKKWTMEYHQSRPGLKTLQERIDDFIVAHEEKLEQEKEEKIAQAAEGGWTVVEHHKGRKKTTDSETGITVGSVAQAAVEDKMTKKKSKEVGLDFYRFQRREAQRNEIMMLQSKFEDDRKRIQQLRAARKFRPY